MVSSLVFVYVYFADRMVAMILSQFLVFSLVFVRMKWIFLDGFPPIACREVPSETVPWPFPSSGGTKKGLGWFWWFQMDVQVFVKWILRCSVLMSSSTFSSFCCYCHKIVCNIHSSHSTSVLKWHSGVSLISQRFVCPVRNIGAQVETN